MSKPSDRPDRPKRFYKAVSLLPDDGGFAVALDGRVAKTPAGAKLAVPTEALGDLLASEWAAQTEHVEFPEMPATRLAFTAIDRTPGARDAVAAEMSKLIAADALCYFADGPGSLIARQEQLWGPWLAWAERELGLVLIRAKGVMHIAQPPETLARAKRLGAELDDLRLSGLVYAGGLYGSAVLALAVERGVLGAEEAFDLSRLDEAFQEEQWGIDHEAAARTAILRRDARMIGAWFKALGD